jgi:hypothetical protein
LSATRMAISTSLESMGHLGVQNADNGSEDAPSDGSLRKHRP